MSDSFSKLKDESQSCLSKIPVVKSIIDAKNKTLSFHYFKDIKKHINYDVLIKCAYISYIFTLIFCIILPASSKDSGCGEGLPWGTHISFMTWIITTIATEFVIWKVCFSVKARNKITGENHRFISYFLMLCFTLSGALSKIDIYTDVAFLAEVNACDNHSSFGIAILIVSIFVFVLTIIFQLWTLFVFSLINQKDSIRPITSNTTRLLLCADMKLLAIMNDKFTVNFYERFGCFNIPTVKVLAFIKLVFEDIMQFILQIVYILILNSKKFTVLYMTATFASSLFSICIAIFVMLSRTGSEPTTSQINKLIDYGNSDGYKQSQRLNSSTDLERAQPKRHKRENLRKNLTKRDIIKESEEDSLEDSDEDNKQDSKEFKEQEVQKQLIFTSPCRKVRFNDEEINNSIDIKENNFKDLLKTKLKKLDKLSINIEENQQKSKSDFTDNNSILDDPVALAPKKSIIKAELKSISKIEHKLKERSKSQVKKNRKTKLIKESFDDIAPKNPKSFIKSTKKSVKKGKQEKLFKTYSPGIESD